MGGTASLIGGNANHLRLARLGEANPARWNLKGPERVFFLGFLVLGSTHLSLKKGFNPFTE